jgi:poly(hydroxyalkanoate) granule-associated protein
MVKQKRKSKQNDSGKGSADISGQLEHVFLAGLGALSNTRKAGQKTFESLVKQGESFRKGATNKTEALIDDVQDAIRGMAGDAQSKATGLIDQMRETPQMDKLQSVFDARIDKALDRLGVASKQDLDRLDAKLDRVLKTVAAQKAAKKAAKKTAKKAVTKKAKKVSKKVARKPAKKAVAKTSAKKTVTKKASKKRVSKKKV